MRLVLLYAAAALIAATQAAAQAPKDVNVLNFPDPQNVAGSVEVTNDPLMVEVVNPSPVAPASRIQLVGFTTATATGGAGVLGLTNLCQAELPGSRMCTSHEVMNTFSPPAGLTGDAWVRPTFTVAVGTGIHAMDESGVFRNVDEDLTCVGWRFSISRDGLTVDANGSFNTGACEQLRSVACCAPVP